jgi:hypothetical protein
MNSELPSIVIQVSLKYAMAAADAIARTSTEVLVAAALVSVVAARVVGRRNRQHREAAFYFAFVAFFVNVLVGLLQV